MQEVINNDTYFLSNSYVPGTILGISHITANLYTKARAGTQQNIRAEVEGSCHMALKVNNLVISVHGCGKK